MAPANRTYGIMKKLGVTGSERNGWRFRMVRIGWPSDRTADDKCKCRARADIVAGLRRFSGTFLLTGVARPSDFGNAFARCDFLVCERLTVTSGVERGDGPTRRCSRA